MSERSTSENYLVIDTVLIPEKTNIDVAKGAYRLKKYSTLTIDFFDFQILLGHTGQGVATISRVHTIIPRTASLLIFLRCS